MAPSSAAEACAEGDWSTAIKLYTAELEEADAPSPSMLCNRALCYCMLDLHRKALKDAEAALQADPNSLVAYLRKGSALQALGRREAAAAAWDSGYRLGLATSADMELTLRLRRLTLDEASQEPSPSPAEKVPPAGVGEQSLREGREAATVEESAEPESVEEELDEEDSAEEESVEEGEEDTAPPSKKTKSHTSKAKAFSFSDTSSKSTRDEKPFSFSAMKGPAGVPQAESPGKAKAESPGVAKADSPSAPKAGSPSVPKADSRGKSTADSTSVPKADPPGVVKPPAAGKGPARGAGSESPSAAGDDPGPSTGRKSREVSKRVDLARDPKSLFDLEAHQQDDEPATYDVRLFRQPQAADTRGVVRSPHEVEAQMNALLVMQSQVDPRHLLHALTGDKALVEAFLSRGIQEVNAGKLDDAIVTFDLILEVNKRSLGALIGRGTALALQNKIKAAVKDFTEAIEVNPRVAEAWKRRAQARAALGFPKEAIEDFNKALEIEPNATKDVLLERGTLFVKLKDYKMALQDLRAAVALEPLNKLAHNFMGLALVGSGECVEGVRAYKQALKIDAGMQEAWVNMGQAHKELADAPRAAECFQRAMDLDPRHVQAHRIYALLKYGLGDHRGAGQMAEQGLEVSPQCIELAYIYASAMHATGEYRLAVKSYDDALGFESNGEEHVLQFLSFYQREIALYTASKLNEPLANFKPDADLQPFFKEAWCKKQPPTLLFPGYSPQPMLPAGTLLRRRKDQLASGTPSALRQRLLDAADRLGRRTQYSCPGFLANTRQHRMAGLAMLEIMQTISAAWQVQNREGAAAAAAFASASPSSSSKKGNKKGSKGAKGKAQAPHGSASPSTPLPAPEQEGGDVTNRHSGSGSGSSSDSEGAGGGVESPGAPGGTPPVPVPVPRVMVPSGVPRAPSSGVESPGAPSGTPPVPVPVPRVMVPRAPSSGVSLKWRDVFNITVRWRQISEPCDPVAWVDQLTEKEFKAGFGSHTPLLIGQTRVVRYYSNFQRAFRIMKQQLLHSGGFSATNARIPLENQDKRRAVAAAKDPKELWELVGKDFWTITHCPSMANPGTMLDGTRLTLVKSPSGFDFAIRTPGTPPRWADYDAEMAAAWEELCQAVQALEQQGSEKGAQRERVQDAILRLGYYWYNFMPLARGTAMVGLATMLGLFLAANMEVTQAVPRGMQVDWEAILSPNFEAFAHAVRPWMTGALRADSPFRSVAKVAEALPTIGSVVSALSSIGDKSS